ncbi:AlpA family phage regulatory protein [Serratia bockelmannii]|uniref:helix-turn-helix transcriptional regulator n=1 Tax=Serratia TaxID=613 RepID=UPI0011B9F561|nr:MULTISPECIES: AlpA family phage regulatory protein [Serratia]TWY26895.1 AlpA family phage regulatory protein [Serratia marcescens]TXE70882.1 AlpA family phage regulatory protein [Serratia nevei]TYR93650.1 AlpA family phage regulatory protein [Serratia marcescens]BEM00835.1 AlpA family transcriptional regulator [Serratia marcescens]
MKAAIRKPQLLAMVPMSESQITKLEKAGDFPQRFALTNRTVAWNLDEVEAWLDKQQAENTGRTPDYSPDVRQRKQRPVR